MSDKKQEEMKEQIASQLRKKDYYQILGISKTATDPDIKKAYRTLALRFHPDKNNVEGAKQVFKKVSHAYSVLIDPQKRPHYDQFGPQQDRPRPQRRAGNPQQDYQYDEYDDIFRVFFGGVPVHHARGNRNFRTFTYNFGNNGQGQAQQRQGGFNLYYIFIVFFLIYTLAPLFQSKPSYSTIPSNEHRFKVKTALLHTEYYVTQQYFEQMRNPDFKRQAEMLVDRQYLIEQQKRCEGKKREKKKYEQMAYREQPGQRRDIFLNQAKAIDTSSCRILSDLRTEHEDYIRDLTYMR